MVRSLLAASLVVPASASFLARLPDHPSLTIEVGVPAKTAEGTVMKKCSISWNREDGRTTYSLSVMRPLPQAPREPGVAVTTIGSPYVTTHPESVPVVEIFDLTKAAEAAMPKFDAPAGPPPANAELYRLYLAEGGGNVWWEVLALPDSKLAVAMKNLQGRIVGLLDEEQKSEMEKAARKPSGIAGSEGADPKIDISMSIHSRKGSISSTSELSVYSKGGKQAKNLTVASSSSYDEEKMKPGANRPEKSARVEEPLAKWPQPDISRFMATYEREGVLTGGRLESREGGVDELALTKVSGEGLMVSETYTDSPASRQKAWQNLHAALKRLLSEKQVRALEPGNP